MVIGIHTYNPDSVDISHGIDLSVIIRQILNCAVPLFIAISGYFLYSKDVSSFIKRMSFWKKQIPKVYIPMLFWSIPYILMMVRGGDKLYSCILYTLVGGCSIFYFIAVIIQQYLLLPVYHKITNRGGCLCVPSFINCLYSNICLYTWCKKH